LDLTAFFQLLEVTSCDRYTFVQYAITMIYSRSRVLAKQNNKDLNLI